MTRRPPRLLGAVVALWTFVAGSSPVPLHQCSMHMFAAEHAAGMAHAGAMHHAAGMAHAGHEAMADMPGMAHDEQSPSAPADHGDDCCHCLTCGGPPLSVVLPGLAFTVPAPSEVAVRTAGFDAPRSLLIVRTPHALPFGNGPPAA
ncbi:MAG: hypothetical protein ACYC3L_04805 [Gemmatimonadaceae bacterium]